MSTRLTILGSQDRLHWAADGGHVETIRVLVENGAHVGALNGDGQTAIDWAKAERRTAAAELLRSLGSPAPLGHQRIR